MASEQVQSARPLWPERKGLASAPRRSGLLAPLSVSEPAGSPLKSWFFGTWADARCQHLAPRARKQSVRPFLGASHQTSPRPDPSRAPPSRADWTSPRPGQSAEGMGELNFWRELGMLLMQIFKVHL